MKKRVHLSAGFEYGEEDVLDIEDDDAIEDMAVLGVIENPEVLTVEVETVEE